MESLLPEPLSENADATTLGKQWCRYHRQLEWFLAANEKEKASDE